MIIAIIIGLGLGLVLEIREIVHFIYLNVHYIIIINCWY